MPLDYDKLMNWRFPEVVQDRSAADSIIYALGVGLGEDPMDERQLPFVYEKELKALPSMAAMLGYPGFWQQDPGTGLDWVRTLHGETGFEIHKPLPATGRFVGHNRVSAIYDKGADKGALILQERNILDGDGTRLATVTNTTFARGDGGFGGDRGPKVMPVTMPDRAPDEVCDLETLPRQALIYRLAGDLNPLHVEPAVARDAGYERPILHGLCTFGVVAHALLRAQCDYVPERFRSMKVRFTAPVMPGETIRTEMWREGGAILFRARVTGRDVVVIDGGQAAIDG